VYASEELADPTTHVREQSTSPRVGRRQRGCSSPPHLDLKANAWPIRQLRNNPTWKVYPGDFLELRLSNPASKQYIF